MLQFFNRVTKTQLAMLIIALAAPLCASAADTLSSNFANAGGGYSLEQMATWGNGCVVNAGKKNLAPGESTVLTVKQDCQWGGVRYKAMKNNTVIGYVAHSFRNKQFTVEISMPCQGENCSFTGFPVQENRSS